MLNEKVLEYVDDVISKVTASKDFKIKLENELIRHIIVASEYASIDEIIDKLGSSKVLADRMSRKMIPEIRKELDRIFSEFDKQSVKPSKVPDINYQELAPTINHDRNCGEYMREESNTNIKLLYIPLIQISSETERVRLPLIGKCLY